MVSPSARASARSLSKYRFVISSTTSLESEQWKVRHASARPARAEHLSPSRYGQVPAAPPPRLPCRARRKESSRFVTQSSWPYSANRQHRPHASHDAPSARSSASTSR